MKGIGYMADSPNTDLEAMGIHGRRANGKGRFPESKHRHLNKLSRYEVKWTVEQIQRKGFFCFRRFRYPRYNGRLWNVIGFLC